MDYLTCINKEFGSMRTILIDEEPWFVGKDVCTAFGDGFTENVDWKRVYQKCPTLGGAQNMVDYQISVDMAKQICMIQRSEKGRLYRQYFLDLEKAWNTPPFTKKGEHKNMNTEQIIELSRKGLELALANEEYDLTVSETNAIRDCSRDKLDLVTTSYYLGLQRGCVYKENCNTGYKKEIIDLIEHLENKGELEYIYTILSTYLTPKKMGRKELSCRTQ